MIVAKLCPHDFDTWDLGTLAITLALYISDVKDDMFSNLQNDVEFFQRTE